MITKRIIDLGVNLRVSELWASAPAVEKQLTKVMTEDEIVQFWVNTLDLSKAIKIKNYSYSIL